MSMAMSLAAASARPGFEKSYAMHADLEHLAHDRDLTDKIVRKRQEEMQRRTKLLDPRKRTMGADHAALDAQIMEKRAAAEAEVLEEREHAQGQLMQDHVLQTLEGVKQAAMRERHKAAVDYSLANLTRERRREYELSDPSQLKKTGPIDIDDQERIGPSSFQRFQGEGAVDQKGHKKKVQGQVRDALLQQMQEKQARERAEREADRQYDEQALTASHVRAFCEQSELRDRRQDKLEEAAENRQLAAQHADRRQARLDRDAAERARHVENVRGDERMREAVDYKANPFTGRVARDFKRLSPEDEQHAYNQRAQQVVDRQLARRQELAEEQEHADAVATQVGVLHALEGERERLQRERHMQVVQHNKSLATAKHMADDEERRKYRSWEHEP
mmetsp:Transcript_45606/g.130121  ORF Transcript_45606/g.130121 Transcript_45606/m.130121 type:complete len:390 (+) Transcript_45606:79-1248(+)